MKLNTTIKPMPQSFPTPPPGSDFDQINQEPFTGNGMLVYGIDSGSSWLGQWFHQETVNDRQPVTGLGFALAKIGDPWEPIYFGLATADQIQNSYFDPTSWEVWGVIYPEDMPQGEYVWVEGTGCSIQNKNLSIIIISDMYYYSGTPDYWILGNTDTNSYTKGKYKILINQNQGDWQEISDKDMMFFTYSEIVQIQCTDYLNQTDCESNGCYWWGGSCHDTPEPQGDVLEKAITCKTFNGCDFKTPGSCYCGDEGPQTTQYAIDEEIVPYSRFTGNDFFGKIFKFEWWHEGQLIWEYTWPAITEHWSDICFWMWWAVGIPGTGHIKWFLNNNYMGQSNDYTIAGGPPPQNVIAIIDTGIWYPGPFAPNEYAIVANTTILNTGDITGKIYGQVFSNPGQPNEQAGPLSAAGNIPPGGTWNYIPVHHIPSNQPPGTLTLGLKVWGETEPEPSW